MKLSEYITKHGDFTLPKINEYDVIGRLRAIGMTQYGTKPKPEPKKIDMSVAISSGIDCESSHLMGDRETWLPCGKLLEINEYQEYYTEEAPARTCRPRFNHIHASPVGWQSCPVPEGFIVKTWSYDLHKCWVSTKSNYLELDWSKVQMFEVTGIQEGWKL